MRTRVWGAKETRNRAASWIRHPTLAALLSCATLIFVPALSGCSSTADDGADLDPYGGDGAGTGGALSGSGGTLGGSPVSTGGDSGLGTGGAPDGAGGTSLGAGGDFIGTGGDFVGAGGSLVGAGGGLTNSGGAPAEGVTEIALEENEAGFCVLEGVIESEHVGFGGSGYSNGDAGVGREITWSIVSTGGPVTFTFRYASSNARPATLLIDDGAVDTIAFPGTTEWTNWTELSSTVELPAGVHAIALSAQAVDGLPNIDSLSVAGDGLAPAECPEIIVEPPTVDLTSLVGFATENGGTTGGAGGQVVTVSNYADLKSYAEGAGSLIIMVEGTITNGAGGGQIRVASNKSLIGVGSTAFLSGVGIDISDENNIIIQNLRVSLVGTSNPGSVNGGDAISISGTSKNVWIDHCELFSENPNTQTDINLYDGLLDIKGQTGFITISWCHLHDHHKGGLVGAADDDLYVDRKVTLHHNFYERVKLRVPMYRGSTGHFFNNYVVGAQDATEIRAGTCVRVERNYYEALHYSIYTPSDSPGSTERIDNIEVSRTSRAYPASCAANIGYDYSSALTANTNEVKTVVPAYAGVGKLP